MEETNNTKERFKELLQEFDAKMKKNQLVYNDGILIQSYANNLFLRFEEIMKSRDSWKQRYLQLKEERSNEKKV